MKHTAWFLSIALAAAGCPYGAAWAQANPTAAGNSGSDHVTAIPRLFNIPTADVLGSLDVHLSGGKAFGASGESGLLGRAGIGFGDVADVEFSTLSVVNTVRQQIGNVPTSAFKMRVWREKGDRPAFAWALRGTTGWKRIQAADGRSSFDTRLTKLYAVCSRSRGPLSGFLGLGLTDVRVRNPSGLTLNATDELQTNLFSPFAGISYLANPRTLVMAEIDGVPRYGFRSGSVARSEDVRTVRQGVVGVRFYFWRYIAADAGVLYRSDFDGIADARIQTNLNVVLPLVEMVHQARAAQPARGH